MMTIQLISVLDNNKRAVAEKQSTVLNNTGQKAPWMQDTLHINGRSTGRANSVGEMKCSHTLHR